MTGGRLIIKIRNENTLAVDDCKEKPHILCYIQRKSEPIM
jgi:hypothetical protein